MTIWVRYLVFGPLVFWGSDLIMRAVTRQPSSGWKATVLLLILCIAYVAAWKMQKSRSGPSLSLSMLIGIFLFGPWCIVFTKTLLAGGFHSVGSWEDAIPLAVSSVALVLYAFQPFFILKMSVDCGSLSALLLALVFLLAAHFLWERHRWILPFFRKREGG